MRLQTPFFIAFAIVVFAAAFPAFADQPENLVRNGSFEGSLLYWHDQKGKSVVDGGKVGAYALKIADRGTHSAPIVLERDAEYTISLWARTVEGEGGVSVGLHPSAREVAVSSGRLWTRGSAKSADLTSEWKRVSFTWKADVKPGRMWGHPHYMVRIGMNEKKEAILIDGVTMVKGNQGTADYIPRRPIEVVAQATNLPGWDGDRGNLYEKGATATLDGFASNPSATSQTITTRWQLIDYEGTKPWSEPIESQINLAAGATKVVPVELPLTATGTVIARFSALNAKGEVIDSSDMPLTSLAYPKHAEVPDARERFGGSFAGGTGAMDKLQRIGFGWTRWWSNNKWQDFEPREGEYDWKTEEYEKAFERGLSCHVVLYGWPDWIIDKKKSAFPFDMDWPAEDPRWDDDSIETAWDRFVKAAVENFRDKPVVFQIANEPGHEKGFRDEPDKYAKFNLRTARLIKKTDPTAIVSLNNVYANPTPPNARLLATKQLENFDIWSWHDYRAGWLMDASGVKRMRQMLEGYNAGHLELWFTEGWMFTNTLVDQPIACTHLTSVESTHAVSNSIAEMSANGHDKIVMFHLLYETHGQSFWDYSGPGVMLWDWYGFPMPTLSVWNSLNHHIGISEAAGFVSPRGANLSIFQDQRNGRAVAIAYADREAKDDAVIQLPVTGLAAEDIMGNAVSLGENGTELILSKTGRPVILTTGAMSGAELAAALEPLDRKHLGFITSAPGEAKTYRLPDSWEGTELGSGAGNPASSSDRDYWRIDRLYPKDKILPENYTPMVWGNQKWIAPDHTHGGHPSATVKNNNIRFGTMGPWGGEMNFRKQGALSFIVPEDGRYHIQFTAKSEPWGGSKATAKVYVMKRDTQRVGVIEAFDLPADKTEVPVDVEIDAAIGHELVFLVEMPNHNNSTNISLMDVKITKAH